LDHAGDGGNSDQLTDEVLDSDNSGDIVNTGYANFDKPSGGWRKGQFIVIASHRKGGKLITALNLAVNQYLKQNLSVCIIPLEMGRKECRSRLLSLLSGIPFERFYKNELSKSDKKHIRRVWKEFNEHGRKNKCRFTVWKPDSCTVGDIVFKLKPMEYDVVYVDYVNLLTPTDPSQKGSNDWQVLSAFYKQLKEAATQMKCVVVGLTQMNTDGSIRYSGAALEDCDCAITWFYQEEEMATHVIKFQVAVARNFKPFEFFLQEDFVRMQLLDYAGGAPSSDSTSSGDGDIAPVVENVSKKNKKKKYSEESYMSDS
jgi:hypothetical protein